MKRLIFLFAVICIAATTWAAATLRSAEADYVHAKRAPSTDYFQRLKEAGK